MGGFFHTDQFCFDFYTTARCLRKEEAEASVAIDYWERADGEPTGYLHNVLYGRIENAGNCKKTRNKQVDRKPHFGTCEKKNLPNHAVSLNCSDELLDKFF